MKNIVMQFAMAYDILHRILTFFYEFSVGCRRPATLLSLRPRYLR